jgi:hypothetical protein
MITLADFVSAHLRNPHDASAVLMVLVPFILFAILIVGGVVFAFVARSAGKAAGKPPARNGTPPKGSP